MMTCRLSALLGIALFLGAGAARAEGAAPAAKTPQMCVYRGAAPYGPRNNPAFAEWLGLPVVWGEDFMPTEDWNNVEGGGWQIGPWSQWKKAVPGRRLVLTVVILPGGWDLSGPKRGIDAGKAVSWEAGARGEYNEHFRKLAENLVKAGLEDSYLRLAHEMNGGWYTWRGKGHEEAFAGYWREIVKTMRAVPGADFRFVLNPTQGYQQFPAETCWPGDEYVDCVGLDVYDQSWLKETYPIAAGATEAEAMARHKKVWLEDCLNGNHGLLFWRDFARAHKKEFAIPEWGVWVRKDGHGGGDNPYFIEQMHRFIMDPANAVSWHCYFDVTMGGDAHHQLSPGADGKYVTDLPLAAAKFKELFGATPAR